MAITGDHKRGTTGDLHFYDENNDTGAVANQELVPSTGGAIHLGKTVSGGVVMGAGTSSSRVTTASADKKMLSFYFENSANTGDNRGMYLRLYQSGTGAGGGEALRCFTTVTGALGTAHGAHISLNFGTTGTLSGLGVACRNTLHIPDDLNPTGTITAGQSEIYFDGDNSSTADITNATHCIHRFILDGDTTARAKATDVFHFVNMPDGASKCVQTGQNEPTWTSKTCLIRCKVNGTVMNLIAVDPS